MVFDRFIRCVALVFEMEISSEAAGAMATAVAAEGETVASCFCERDLLVKEVEEVFCERNCRRLLAVIDHFESGHSVFAQASSTDPFPERWATLRDKEEVFSRISI